MHPVSTLLKPQLLSSLHSPNYLLFIPQITFYSQPKLFPISTPSFAPQIISYLYSSLYSLDYLLCLLLPLLSRLSPISTPPSTPQIISTPPPLLPPLTKLSPISTPPPLLPPLTRLSPISTPSSTPQIISYLYSSLHSPDYLLSLLLPQLPRLSPISTPLSTPQIISYLYSSLHSPNYLLYLLLPPLPRFSPITPSPCNPRLSPISTSSSTPHIFLLIPLHTRNLQIISTPPPTPLNKAHPSKCILSSGVKLGNLLLYSLLSVSFYTCIPRERNILTLSLSDPVFITLSRHILRSSLFCILFDPIQTYFAIL